MRAPARALALALLVAAGCPGGGGARPPAPDVSLFARLGGMDGIRALVDELAARLAADPGVQALFARTDFRRFKARMVVRLCALAGGPCREERARRLKEVHAPHRIRGDQFEAFLAHVRGAMTTLGAGPRERDELVRRLRPLRGEIVWGPDAP